MKRFRCILTILILTAAAVPAAAQKKAVENWHRKDTVIFRYPLDIPPEISGSFGELRSTHFHGGTDFRTLQREGLPVYGVAPGRIIRAEVSKTGYGKALYVRHAGGMMSLYAHLQKFPPAVEKQIKKRQKKSGLYEVELEGLNLKVPARKPIAYSGNTGSSGGPHLHLEIRIDDSVRLNPSCWGLPIYDTVPPVFYYLAVYEDIGRIDTAALEAAAESYSESRLADNFMDAPSCDYLMQRALKENYKQTAAPVSNTKYYQAGNLPDTLRLHGACGFGLCALDYIQDMPFKYGLYELAFLVEHDTGAADTSVRTDTLAYYKLDRLTPSVYNGIRHHLDNDFYTQHKKRMEKSRVENEDHPTPYSVLHNRGTLAEPAPGSASTRRLTVIGRDFSGNETRISCVLLSL